MVRQFYKKTITAFIQQKLLFLFCSIFLASSFFSDGANAQCLTTTFGQYPTATFTPTCGSGTQQIVTDAYGGEYSNVTVVAGNTYIFSSGPNIPFITIADNTAATAYTSGTSPVTWVASVSGTVRFITHTNSSCGNYSATFDQPRSVACTSPGCTGTPAPGNTISTVTGACLGVPFTLSLQNATTGAGVSYVWQSADDAAFTVNVATLSSTAATQTIASQTSAKYYHCSVTCSGNTGISTPVNVTQNAPSACYCTPVMASGCTDGDVIARVVLNTLDNNSGTGCPSGVGGNGYTDYTASAYTTTLVAGNTYNCQVWAGQYSGNYAAWIDYNDNGVFDSNERIGFTTAAVAGSNTVGVLGSSATFPITLSCNPTPGPHRLRIREVFSTAGSAITPCTTQGFGYGEVEDYIITVAPPLPCPAPSALASNTPTINGATITWNAGCVETDWAIEFGATGFTPGTGTTVTATNDTTVVSTMPCGSTLDVYLRANCLSNGYSTYVGPISVTTLACPCTGNPASANSISSVANACPNTAFTLSLDNTYSTVTGITYQWESSPAAAGTWTPISGGTTSTYAYTTGITTATDFRCVVTCATSTLTTNSTPVSVGVLSVPVGNTQADPIVVSFTGNSYSNSNNTANCYTSTYTGANSQASPDVYYQFVAPPCMDSIVISLCGTSWDTYMHLLDNTGTQIEGDDDDCPLNAASLINRGGLIAGQTYYVVVEGYGTNTGAFTLDLNLYDKPLVAAATVLPSDFECEGTTMSLSGSVTGTGTGFTYSWAGPAPVTNATNFNVTYAHDGIYTVTVSDANACSTTTTIAITILAAPAVTASATTPICLGSSTTLVGGGAGVGGTYVWDNSAVDNTPFTPTVAGTTTYIVTGTDGNLCTATSSVSLVVNNAATFNAPVYLATACPTNNGGSVVVSASSASTFAISPSTSQPSPGIFTSMIGGTNYMVTLTDGNLCTNTTMISATSASNGELANASSTNASSTSGNTCGILTQTDNSTLNYYGATCDDLIATIVDASGGNVLGSVNACVTVLPTVPTYNGQPYLPRYYDITPTNQGPADITLYFTQDDFDDYNAAAGSFPQIPAVQATGTTTFCISQVPGGFLPGASGATTIVHTVTATWNATNSRWEVTLPVASFSGFYCHACNPLNSALPASITNFKGTKTETTDLLTWTTTSELNNASFNILYSNDGKNYSRLTSVNSKASNGNSNVTLNYNAENTMPKLGHNYYKLEQVDIDGKSMVNTQVVDLMWGANGSTISVYPNPTSDELNIDIYTTKTENSAIKVLDMSGRILKEIQTKLQMGANSIKMNIGELATGIYTIQILENNKITQVSKVEKK